MILNSYKETKSVFDKCHKNIYNIFFHSITTSIGLIMLMSFVYDLFMFCGLIYYISILYDKHIPFFNMNVWYYIAS